MPLGIVQERKYEKYTKEDLLRFKIVNHRSSYGRLHNYGNQY